MNAIVAKGELYLVARSATGMVLYKFDDTSNHERYIRVTPEVEEAPFAMADGPNF